MPDERKRRCVFCGNEGVTREHVWPQWINKLLDERPGDTSMTVRSNRDNKGRKAPRLDMQLRQVSGPCNTRWMCRLEEQAKPILTPMIIGEMPVELTPVSQSTRANWAMKTVLMSDCAHGGQPRHYPNSVYSAFFYNRHPDRQTAVWLAAYDDPFSRFYASSSPITNARLP
jgi:hypothetical protein